MTVQTSVSKVVYHADGNTTSFAVPFYFFDKQIAVYKDSNQTPLIEGTDYTVTGSFCPSGGEITFFEPPAEDSVITILRQVDLTQLIKFMEGEAFPASDYEYALDKVVMALQQIKERVETCVTIPRGLSLTAEETAQLLVFIQENLENLRKIPELFTTLAAINNRFNDYYNKAAVIEQINQKMGLCFTHVPVVVTSAFSDQTFSGYPLRVDIDLPNVNDTHIPMVCFNPKEALSGNFAPVARSYNHGVSIFMKEMPDDDFYLASIVTH